MVFCRCGTSSIGIRTPRSPRATMIESETSIISERFSIPSAVSIFAINITSFRPRTVRTETMSNAVLTNETARISNFSLRSASRRSRSSAVGRRSAIIDVGSESPGLPITPPPEITTVITVFPVAVTSSDVPPSPRCTRSPVFNIRRTSSRSTAIREFVEVSPKAS